MIEKCLSLTDEQFDERDKILESYFDSKEIGGIRYIRDVPASIIRELLNKGLADPEDQQNYAPTLNEICRFCEQHPEFTIHGYVVSRERDDARVTAEGIETDHLETAVEDLMMFRFADDFRIDTDEGSFYCWYD